MVCWYLLDCLHALFTRPDLFLSPPTRRGGSYAIRSVSLSFVLPICEQVYSKSNQLISSKLRIMIGPTNRKNWLTFDGNPDTDTDFGSLLHFPHHCGIGDFRRIISIFSYSWFSHSAKKTDADNVMNPQHFGSDPAHIRIRIRINPGSNPGSLFAEVRRLGGGLRSRRSTV